MIAPVLPRLRGDLTVSVAAAGQLVTVFALTYALSSPILTVILAEGDYVIAHGRFSGRGRPRSWIAADVLRFEDGKLAEHWDVLQDEAIRAESVSGLPMFSHCFPA